MPYPRSFSFRRWDTCPRCGLDWPLNELSRDYTGVRVCPECYDQPGYDEYRRNYTFRLEELKEDDGMGDII